MEGHEYFCTACSSKEILKNCLLEWDVNKQEWLEDENSYLICSNCGSEDVIEKSIHEEMDLCKPIVQYGIHIIDVYYPSEFLEKEFNIDCIGLTIVFERDTMELNTLLGTELLDGATIDKVVNHARGMFKENT